jgi:maltooligosyltrehalose trehalohydrolase
MIGSDPSPGALYLGNGRCRFCAWAPLAESVDVHLLSPADRIHRLARNRRGERLSVLVPFSALKLAAACVVLAPYIPLLFMGEEYGETAPFPYFIRHTDSALIKAVREGRRQEFSGFQQAGEPPDPQAEETYLSARLNHSLRQDSPNHRTLHLWYRELLRLRRENAALSQLSKEAMEIQADVHHRILFARRWSGTDEDFLVLYFTPEPVSASVPLPKGTWEKRLDSNDLQWGGGPADAAPERLISIGEVALQLAAGAVILFSKTEEVI